MAISVTVPKDLSNIQDKVVFNLTKRQVICFAAAAAIGVPLYLFTKEPLGSEVAVLLMVIVMMPAFFIKVFNRLGKTHDHGASTPSHIRIQLKMDRCETTLLDGSPCT